MTENSLATEQCKQRSRWIGALLLLIVLIVDVLLMPRTIWPGDTAVWRREAATILTTGHLWIDLSSVANKGARGQYYVLNPNDGRYYSKYGIANAVFVMPPLIAERLFTGNWPTAENPGVVILNCCNILISLLLAWILYVMTARYSDDPIRRAAFVAACLFATFVWYYQRAQESEVVHVLFFAAGFECLLRGVRKPAAWWLVIAWAFFAALILSRVFYIILIPWTLAVVVLEMRSRWKDIGPALLLPPIAILAILALINNAKFGSPLLTGYHQWWPEEHVPGENWMEGIFGLLFSCHWSMFLYFPLLFPAMLGIRQFTARHRADSIAIYSLVAITVIILGSIVRWRGEYTYGPRYLIFILPLAALPALEFLNTAGKLALSITAVVLLISTTMQFEVIRSEFWLFYRVEEPLEKHMGREVAESLFDEHESILYHELYSHQDDLDSSILFRHILHNHDLTPDEYNQYRVTVYKSLHETNLYWWPPPEK
jgi:hypothetical protein